MITPSFSLTATERVLPKLALDFTTASLDPRITFSRTTSATNPATYVNSSGYVTSATNDQPRFDYDPITLACKGLLIEESRTNLLTYSNDFTNAAWGQSDVSISAGAITSPDGTLSGSKLIESATTAVHYLSRSITLSGVYAFSVYAKAGERTTFTLGINDFGAAGKVFFDLSAGTVTVTTGATVASGSIQAQKNGWYRCTLITPSLASGTKYPLIGLQSGNSYAGDGTSGIYIYGAQLEAGVFATSFIPTTTTALTRNADSAAMTGSNFTSWFDSVAGTIVFQAAQQVIFPQTKTVGSLTDGGNGFNVYRQSAGTINGYVRPGGLVLNPGATAVAGVPWKAAFAYSGGNCSYCAKSSSIVTGSYTTVTANLTTLTIGALYAGATEIFNGTVNRIWFYPQKFTDAQLQAITHD